ncbi:phenazine biosynthesis-like protein, putative [Talaromyces stipitatus ATCC 10500]|uniref:Phenazine biosynthesis-like protein, putative n=1 Tax=Talaromyces stipitatus (strain ATCC 10500 / CBS 375.48 / QM 6759 / NRRL 1006) TaxID=441959 RepID=B8MDV5_TALSN|nr:phenazine biosynthesis-like protein, putative [Talaromyces stipitatus ATCC 10500]EED18334.1 phenazine biosynthesis-like protein, putative [Talaromyces stipitatus ATCC 10500]
MNLEEAYMDLEAQLKMSPQTIPYVTLDVFTKTIFEGNPLGVVFLPSPTAITQKQKQQIAKEFNYSETIFVHPVDSQRPTAQRIDIFTTTDELPFAGHPTIGAASWVLFLSDDNVSKVNTILTKAGPIPISLKPTKSDEASALIPHNVRIHQKRFPFRELLRLHPSVEPFLNAAETESGKGFPIVSIVNGMTQIHVELPSLEALAAVGPAVGGESVPVTDITQGGYLDEGWGGHGHVVVYFYVRNVVDEVTGKKVIRTRMFLESEEDPATGSAASGLASYLVLSDAGAAGQLQHDFHVVQGVEIGRRSDIGLRVVLKEKGEGIESVELSGSSVKVAKGEIRVN